MVAIVLGESGAQLDLLLIDTVTNDQPEGHYFNQYLLDHNIGAPKAQCLIQGLLPWQKRGQEVKVS